MAQVGTLDFKGFVESRKGQRAGSVGGEEHAYAYVADRNTRLAFQKMKPVELAVAGAVRFFKSVGKADLLGHAVKVGPNQFPRVHALVQHCAQTLGIATPTVYIVNSPHMNAATYGTNDDSFILVHSALIDNFTDAELLNVIGHECGHIHNSHVVYLTAMYFLQVMAERFLGPLVRPATVALAGWSRRAEVTCDRAGLLCCKSLDVATATMAKLALGSSKLFAEFNLDAFLEQYEEGKGNGGRFAELRASHPYLPKRVLALRSFAESELFRKHIGAGEGGLPMEQVDEKVHEIIKVLG